MVMFFWDDNLSVGNAVIDDDHRHLIGLLNNLYKEMSVGKGPAALGLMLNDLVEYTRGHFKREEEVMQRMDYPEFLEHKEEHDKLARQVLEMQKEFVSGEKKLSVVLLKFLFNWLFQHIMQVDKKLAQAIRKAAPGRASNDDTTATETANLPNGGNMI